MAKSADNAAGDEGFYLVLQGGGALGSYQAGVVQALHEHGYDPEWLAGISIGSINCAIIAGNPPEKRLEKLRAFWDRASELLPEDGLEPLGFGRPWFNEVSAAMHAAFGVPGFFAPRVPSPFAAWPGSDAAISFYDTAPLRATLLELVDFDLLNSGPIRVSVGAVNVLSGNLVYFDSNKIELTPEHIMASGALPPAFPPVMIDGEPYWDGGIVSNAPLQYVLDHKHERDAVVFQVDLFHARGDMPLTLADVTQREKDIRFSSRTRLNTDMEKELLNLRGAAERLIRKLPPEWRDDPDVEMLSQCEKGGSVAVVHLINKREFFQTSSKDYEFSRLSVNEHWEEGYHAALTSVTHPAWRRRRRDPGVVTYDLVRGEGDVRGGLRRRQDS